MMPIIATLNFVRDTSWIEEVDRQEYQDLYEVLDSMVSFIERVYSQKRLHSSLICRPPSEFERIPNIPVAREHGHTFPA